MPTEPPIIDTHVHVWTRRMPLSTTAWSRPGYDFTGDDLLATLVAHGVAFGVIAAASIYDDFNDYTLEILRRHRRLRGTVVLRPDVDPYTLRAMSRDGVVGVRFVWAFLDTLPDIRTVEYRRFLTRLADLNWHVELLVDGPRLPAALSLFADTGVKLVVDHFGYFGDGGSTDGPEYADLLRTIERGNTWVKVSAAYRYTDLRQPQEYMNVLLKSCGPERLLWGSDAPFTACEDRISYGGVLQDFYTLVPDGSVRRVISDSGLRFYMF